MLAHLKTSCTISMTSEQWAVTLLSLYDIVLAVNIARGEHQNTAYYGKGLLTFITSIPWTNIGHIRIECSKVRKKHAWVELFKAQLS